MPTTGHQLVVRQIKKLGHPISKHQLLASRQSHPLGVPFGDFPTVAGFHPVHCNLALQTDPVAILISPFGRKLEHGLEEFPII